jgi:hypothetical protein
MRDVQASHSARVMHELHQVQALRPTRAMLVTRSPQPMHVMRDTLSMPR